MSSPTTQTFEPDVGTTSWVAVWALAGVGIGYVHLKDLGTPKPGRDAAKKGDRATLEKVYAGQLELPEAQAEGAKMLSLAEEKPSALLCFERDPAVCHRTLLMAAVGEGWEVVDFPNPVTGGRSACSVYLGRARTGSA